MSEQYRNFMGYLWYQKEDNIYTIGLNEDALEDFDEVQSLDLPREGEEIEEDVVCGALETDEGPLDIYSPVSGTVIEVNSSVVEDPSLIMDDPYDAWLIKLEVTDEADEDDEDDEDEDEDEDDDYDEDEDEEEDED